MERDEEIATKVDMIENIRTSNNRLWMEIMRIALWYAPQETKKVLASINHNDGRISEILREISDENK